MLYSYTRQCILSYVIYSICYLLGTCAGLNSPMCYLLDLLFTWYLRAQAFILTSESVKVREIVIEQLH